MSHEQQHDSDHSTKRDPSEGILSTVHPDLRTSAQVIRDALASATCTQDGLGEAAGVSKGKASGWCIGLNAPSLLHLVRIGRARPAVLEAIARGLAVLCATDRHIARPLPERVCQALQELGHVSAEVTQALAGDGVVDKQERRAIRREIQHARDQLDQLEGDLNALLEQERKGGS